MRVDIIDLTGRADVHYDLLALGLTKLARRRSEAKGRWLRYYARHGVHGGSGNVLKR